MNAGVAALASSERARAQSGDQSTEHLSTEHLSAEHLSTEHLSTEHRAAVEVESASRSGHNPVGRTRPKLSLLSLVAATFFVVSGGPYGLEDIVAGHGYGRTLLLLLVVPLIWSLPITLLVGELGAALPKEGGYYAWVRRALGPFWGVQEAWLALAMSLFDMAIYPTLMVTYLGRLFPSLADMTPGGAGWFCGIAMIALCAWWNIRGSRAVGIGSVLLGAALLLPFVAIVGCVCLGHGSLRSATELFWVVPSASTPPAPGESPLWISGVLLCMWNYMGWDNASTVAAEVERPQRNYPRAMLLTIVLVAACYVVPVLCASASGIAPEQWSTGSWVEVGRRLGGPWLGWVVAAGGVLCGLGMFNVLVMSYSRLPMAMARDGMLPRWLRKRDPHSGAPTRIILIGAVLYAACMGLGFRHLVEIDVLLYGAVLTLEFVSLIVLRLREPELARPFRIRGGVPTIVAMSLLPLGLIGVAMYAGRQERALWGLSSLQLGAMILAFGPLLYAMQRMLGLGSKRPSAVAVSLVAAARDASRSGSDALRRRGVSPESAGARAISTAPIIDVRTM